MALRDTRKSGDETPFWLFVDLGESANLGAAPITYRLTSIDGSAVKVDDGDATAEDVSADVGAPPLSVWRLQYQPTEAEVTVTVPSDFLGEFTVTYAGGEDRHYPKEGYQHVSINP